MRLDIYLYTNGYTDSRRKAQTLIAGGNIYVNGKQITKASHETADGTEIEIRGDVMPYVGRGGYKLEGALDVFCVAPAGFVCADIGASTGGFTDCLLQRGAAHVYAIDSGSDQLAEKLRADPRVTVMEHFNAKNLTADDIGGVCDLCVCDVSFISLTHIFAPVTRVLKPYNAENDSGSFVTLIKPQFEAGRESIGKNGIIRDEKVYLRVLTDIVRAAASHGLYCKKIIPSPILGGDGNREFLGFFAYHAPDEADISLSDKNVLMNIIHSDNRKERR